MDPPGTDAYGAVIGRYPVTFVFPIWGAGNVPSWIQIHSLPSSALRPSLEVRVVLQRVESQAGPDEPESNPRHHQEHQPTDCQLCTFMGQNVLARVSEVGRWRDCWRDCRRDCWRDWTGRRRKTSPPDQTPEQPTRRNTQKENTYSSTRSHAPRDRALLPFLSDPFAPIPLGRAGPPSTVPSARPAFAAGLPSMATCLALWFPRDCCQSSADGIRWLRGVPPPGPRRLVHSLGWCWRGYAGGTAVADLESDVRAAACCVSWSQGDLHACALLRSWCDMIRRIWWEENEIFWPVAGLSFGSRAREGGAQGDGGRKRGAYVRTWVRGYVRGQVDR